MRILTSIQMILAVLQPISIGQYLSGRYAMLNVHSGNAVAVELLAFVVLAVSIWFVIAGGRVWVLLASLALFFAVNIQAAMGYTRQLGVHIPLGVAVVGAMVVLCIWAWSPASSRFRPRRQRTRPVVAGQPAEPEQVRR